MAAQYDDQKRAAVLAALLAGQSVSQIARDYAVSRRTVQLWRDAAGLRATHVSHEKYDELGELVAGALRANLHAIQVLAQRATEDEDWFRKQSAADIAVLTGVLTDKAVRILEALESAEPEPPMDSVESPEGAEG